MISRRGKVLVTGATGMVGRALLNELKNEGFSNIIAPTRQELDLAYSQEVDSFFDRERPSYVYMVAAKVGGIGANMADPVGFLLDNLKVEINLFEACHKYNTKKNLFLGSSCIYPKECSQPIKEEYLMSGRLEPTNEGYALAKITGLKLAEYYYRQYGMLTVCPMLCNAYGTGNSFDLQNSHVLSALVKRFVDAKDDGKKEVVLWGLGVARREFIHVDDVVGGLIFLMDNYNSPEIINLGAGKDITISELAGLIARKVGFEGTIKWDRTKPDGMLRKCLNTDKIEALGFSSRVSLKSGIEQTIAEYKAGNNK